MAAELKQKLGVQAKLTEGAKGVFDVVVDGKKVFSKHEAGRFPEEGEISDLLSERKPKA